MALEKHLRALFLVTALAVYPAVKGARLSDLDEAELDFKEIEREITEEFESKDEGRDEIEQDFDKIERRLFRGINDDEVKDMIPKAVKMKSLLVEMMGGCLDLKTVMKAVMKCEAAGEGGPYWKDPEERGYICLMKSLGVIDRKTEKITKSGIISMTRKLSKNVGVSSIMEKLVGECYTQYEAIACGLDQDARLDFFHSCSRMASIKACFISHFTNNAENEIAGMI